MSWFILALIAILFWSGSDVFSKVGSKADDKYSHWKMVMAVGIVMGAHAIFLIATGTSFNLFDIITYMPASFLYILAMVVGYVGLRYIELSVSSPICNSSGAVAMVLCLVFLNETMSALQGFAVALVIAAVIALGFLEKKQDDALRAASNEAPDKKHTRSIIAILFPILYCIIDGLGTFADAFLLDVKIAEEQANIAYELTFLMMAFAAFIYVVIIKKQKIVVWQEKPKMIAALCETAGQFAYIFAIGANAVVAAPMISSYCIVSVVWSRIFLKEKLSWQQYAVIAAAGVGIAILGIE
ncbi:MAG: hypothetical protein EOM30_10545 [Clostridia bacterium]|nr:hypothetical protein [Clostridia bacterium]NLS84795.1 EamA family transporter [Oscillospiraceae bacterium]